MSVANFGPTFHLKDVTNANGDLNIAVANPGAVLVTYDLIKAAGGAALPLVVAPGTYAIRCVASMNANNAASVIQYGQCFLENAAGDVLGTSQFFCGAYGDGHNISYKFEIDVVLSFDVETSLFFRYKTNGNDHVQLFTGIAQKMFATKLN